MQINGFHQHFNREQTGCSVLKGSVSSPFLDDYSQLEVLGTADRRLPEVEQLHQIARSVLMDRQTRLLNALVGQHLKITAMGASSRNQPVKLQNIGMLPTISYKFWRTLESSC